MPKEFTSTTFSDVYKDDYSDSAGFHRVLFNSGLPLQARELTQLQSIIHQQIKTFGDNVFLDGAAVGSGGYGLSVVSYIQIENPTAPLEDYVGVTLQGTPSEFSAGLLFRIVQVEEGTETDPPTLFGSYVSSNQSAVSQDVQTSSLSFSESEELRDIRLLSGKEGLPELIVLKQPSSSTMESTGKGLLFGVKSAHFWTQGHFVFTAQQLLTISKYSVSVDVDLGFEVTEDIVTVEDDDTLFDNQGAVPNLSSPGADRYRIRLKLATRSEVGDPSKFVYLASVRKGEVTQESGGSKSYNEIERRMADRQDDTTGDFIAKEFDIRFLPGNSDTTLRMTIPGTNTSGTNSAAFVDGFFLEHFNDKSFTIAKPTSATSDSGQATPIAYKNYVNVPYSNDTDNFLGNLSGQFSLSTQSKIVLYNATETPIGTARIKHIINTLDDIEGYRIHLYDLRMDSGKNARDVREFSPYNDATTKVSLALVSGQLYAVSPEINTSLHNIPGGRVKSISNLNFTVQRQFTATSNGEGKLQVTTNNNEGFDDLSRWVFVNNSSRIEEVVGPTDISLNSSTPQTATCTVSVPSQNYTVFAYVEKNSPNPKVKTFSRQADFVASNLIDDEDGQRFEFGLYDGIALIEARANTPDGEVITDQVKFDGGQRDNFYGPVTLKPSGLPAGVTIVYAKFEYFSWGATGDYFCVNSYFLSEEFTYADIPTFSSPRDGSDYDTRNHIDFRPKLDPSSNEMSEKDRFEVPRDGDNVSYDIEWYNLRIDTVALGYNPSDFSTEIRINSGVEDLNPQAPEPKVAEMNLFNVRYGGNTLDVRDLSITKQRHKRYQMTDIAKLDGRLSSLEETVSLSFLEQEASNLVELNSNGEVRSKTGFFVDDFKWGWTYTAGMFETQRSMDEAQQTASLIYTKPIGQEIAITPRSRMETSQILIDSDNIFVGRTSVEKEDVIRKGDLVYIDYKEVLDSSMLNEVISWISEGSSQGDGWINVNPFDVFAGEGFMKISPASDNWVDTYHLPNIYYNDETITIDNTPGPEAPGTPQGCPPGYWKKTQVYHSTSVINSVEEDTVAYSIPFARSREIFGKVQGLRPNSRYWPFFDNVNVEQWTITETEEEYRMHLSKGDHLKSYPSVDVTILQHPRNAGGVDTTLMTNSRGELFFSFWLPNNAPVPSPNGNSYNSLHEWENWIEAQRRESENYPDGATDPQVFNEIGWKFRTGAVSFVVNDVSVSIEDLSKDSLGSHAKTGYVSSGSLDVSQKTIHQTTTNVVQDSWSWYDPIAQSIMIDGRDGVPGVFVTKIDAFFRNAPQTGTFGGEDLGIPVQLQIREMLNGYPVGGPAGDGFRVYKSADEVYETISKITNKNDIDDVLSHPITFEFDEPIYLQANTEYAVVLMAESDKYEAYISTTGSLILGETESRVNKQPATGSLFISQNGSTWTANQNQNLAYRIYTAKFKQSGTFNMYNEDFDKYNHNTPRLEVDKKDSTRYRVNHLAHGLGIGDKVGLVGLDSSADYFGVSGSTLMDSDLAVDEADMSGYFVKIDGSFSDVGSFGADSAKTNQAFNFDNAHYMGASVELTGTSIENEVSFISGVSYSKIALTANADPRFDFGGRNVKMSSDRKMMFNEPKMIANPQLELDEIYPAGELSPSIVMGRTLKTTSTSTFGGPSAAAIADQGYVSDVSPFVDLQRSLMLMINNVVDNQPLDSASASDLNNAPSNYVPESHPKLGSSPAKHLIKPVILGQAANGIRVFIDAFTTIVSDFDVYYRTTADPDGDIYEESFTLIAPENEVPPQAFNPETFDPTLIAFKEYRYLIGGEDGTLEDFTKFQIKIVMRSTNTCEVPIIKSIRTIALI